MFISFIFFLLLLRPDPERDLDLEWFESPYRQHWLWQFTIDNNAGVLVFLWPLLWISIYLNADPDRHSRYGSGSKRMIPLRIYAYSDPQLTNFNIFVCVRCWWNPRHMWRWTSQRRLTMSMCDPCSNTAGLRCSQPSALVFRSGLFKAYF